MDVIRLGGSLRAVRRRRGWTQAKVGAAAGVSRETVSRIERGQVGGVRVMTLVTLADALDVRLDVALRWRGEALERLLDAGHARLVERTVHLLGECGWESNVEVTYSRYGERGSVDILAREPASGTVLVVEVKSVVPDIQAMLAGIDRKGRIAPHLARERGWGPAHHVGRLLVLPAGRTVERRIAQHRVSLAAALPERGQRVRAWLRDPGTRGLAGILLLPDSRTTTKRRSIRAAPPPQRRHPPPDSRRP